MPQYASVPPYRETRLNVLELFESHEYEVYDSLSSEELDERLSRQLLRLQSQTDRVMEVFVTSLVASSVFG